MTSNLSEFFIEKAKIELGEDESRKRHTIERIKEWLAKHPFISNFPKDDIFYLMYLRNQKYVLNNAIKRLEGMAIFIKSHPKWYDFNDEGSLGNICDVINNGYISVSKSRDSNGCAVVSITPRKFNMNKYDFNESARTLITIVTACSIEEETQIAGYAMYVDMMDCSFEMFTKIFVPLFNEFAKLLASTPCRINEVNVCGIPSFLVSFADIFKSLLSEKLQNRFRILSSKASLCEIIDEKLIYGDENIQYTKDLLRKNIEMLRKMCSYEIDFDKVKNNSSDSNIENFRKLDID